MLLINDKKGTPAHLLHATEVLSKDNFSNPLGIFIWKQCDYQQSTEEEIHKKHQRYKATCKNVERAEDNKMCMTSHSSSHFSGSKMSCCVAVREEREGKTVKSRAALGSSFPKSFTDQIRKRKKNNKKKNDKLRTGKKRHLLDFSFSYFHKHASEVQQI